MWLTFQISQMSVKNKSQRQFLIFFFFPSFDSVSIEPISNVTSDYTASHCCSFQVSNIKLLNSLWRRKWKWMWGGTMACFIIITTVLVNSIVNVFFLKVLWICTKRSKLTLNLTSKLKRIREGNQFVMFWSQASTIQLSLLINLIFIFFLALSLEWLQASTVQSFVLLCLTR